MGQTYSDMKQKVLVLQRLKMVFENPLQNITFTSDDGQASVEIIN